MKHIHRLIVTSNAYRMASERRRRERGELALDRDNRLLVANEHAAAGSRSSCATALFYVAGNLDLTRGGPDIALQAGVRQRRGAASISGTPTKSRPSSWRCSTRASVNECYRRSESVVPQQALALANSDVSLDAVAAAGADS